MQDIELKTTPPTCNFVEKKFFSASLPTNAGIILTANLPRELWRRRIWVFAITDTQFPWLIGRVRLLNAGQLVVELPFQPLINTGAPVSPFNAGFWPAGISNSGDAGMSICTNPTTFAGTSVPGLELFTQADTIELQYDTGIPLGGANALAYIGVLSDKKIL